MTNGQAEIFILPSSHIPPKPQRWAGGGGLTVPSRPLGPGRCQGVVTIFHKAVYALAERPRFLTKTANDPWTAQFSATRSVQAVGQTKMDFGRGNQFR
jgi:hypothetical protein